ncbi:MAG: preprotein translocase subunit SecG [Pseudomonadota bacterium]
MEQLILVTHLLLALAIIGLIMLQQGKGADMGASFGAGASQTLFGSSGSGNVLTRTTAWLVALFFATSFGLAVIAKDKTSSAGEFDLQLPEPAPLVEDSELPVLDEQATQDGPVFEDLPALDGAELMDADMSMGVDADDDLPSLPGAEREQQ